MRTVRISALLCAVSLTTLLFGCSSQAHFSNEELDQMKHKPTGGIPAYGLAAMEAKQKQAQQLMLEDMKKRGIQPNANNMPPGMSAPSGTPPPAAEGSKP